MKLYGLKNVRNIYGFTMRGLAKEINVSANAINLWENGDIDVPDARVNSLAEFLLIEKSLLGIVKHDVKDLMKIEIARANFKIKEYRMLIKDDDESIKSILNEIALLKNEANDTQYEYDSIKSLIEKIIRVFSMLDSNYYDDFDSIIRELIDKILDNKNELERFKILFDVMHEDEDVESWGEDYVLYCDVYQVIQKQIKDNIDKLYKIKLYEEGKYKPYWEVE